MMPLACERKGEGVTSGINATTGVRQSAMLSSKELVQATKKGNTAVIGMSPNAAAEIGAPIKINGMRRPIACADGLTRLRLVAG